MMMWVDALDDAWRWGLFAAALMGLYGALLFALLFLGLAFGWTWRRLTVGSWHAAIRAAERKAFEQ
jgi:hypothetical protein